MSLSEHEVRHLVRLRRDAMVRVLRTLEAVRPAPEAAPEPVRRLDEALDRVYRVAVAELGRNRWEAAP